MRALLWIVTSLLCFNFLFAEEDKNTSHDDTFTSSLVKTQNLLSTIINSVSAISGEWIQSETDFVVLGPEPILLNRYYGGDQAHSDQLGYNWDFNHPRKLVIDIQEKKVDLAHIHARFHQSSGIATIHESSTRQDQLYNAIVPLTLSRTQGLTNCRGEISAKTNLHNTIIQLDVKGNHCAATTGSGLLTYYEYSHQQNMSQWKQGKIGVGYVKKRALNHYRPVYERKPNGNTLHFKKESISATNSSKTNVYGNIEFHDESAQILKVQASDGKSATYKFAIYDHPLFTTSGQIKAFQTHRFYLSEVNFSHKPSEKYEYIQQPPTQLTENPKNPLMIAKRQPNGRFQEVEYYHKGPNSLDMSTPQEQHARMIYVPHEDDFRAQRVKIIKEPVGHNAKAVITHRFIYESDKNYGPAKKTHSLYNGRTKVYDAYLRKTIYEYNQEHRPTSIQRFDSHKKLYSEECFTWDDRYAFPSDFPKDKRKPLFSTTQSQINQQLMNSLSESIHPSDAQASGISKKEQVENLLKACLKAPMLQTGGDGNLLGKYLKNAKGKILYAHFFKYDKRGNITRDRLYGNLTGRHSQIIELDLHNKPRNSGCEYYEKRFTYSNDGLNLLKSEEEDNGKEISYDYYPDSDLLAAKTIKENGIIRIRQFFYYDSNATLIKLIQDDGCKKDETNWNGISERLITYINPRKTAPFGFPESIQQKYLDRGTKQEKLLKKINCHYSPEGHLLQQDHYDANNQLHHSLYWEYDTHGNTIREVNAGGAEINRKYDDNDNLIREKGPRSGDCKKYEYDFANRLISITTEADDKRWCIYYKYDLIGNRISETDRYGNETKYEYDDFNRLIRTIYPMISEESPPPQTETHYDCLDHPILEINAKGFSTRKTYNVRGKTSSILHPDGQLERFEYNLDGTLAKTIASNGTSTHCTYDFLRRVIKETTYSADGEFLCESSHQYNSFHKISSTDADGLTTHFEYDGAGRLIKKKSLDKIEIYEYDSLSRLAKKKERFDQNKMKVSCTEYDVMNQVIEERIENERGEILKKARYAYDLLGNRTHVIEETAAGLSQHITLYNFEKKPIRTIDPEGNETHISYDRVKNQLGQFVLQTKTTDPLGRRTVITFDAMENPVNIKKLDLNGVFLAHQELSYDGQKNLIRIIDHVILHGEIVRSIHTSFVYQEMGQLTCLTQAEGLPEQQITHTHYNAYGQKEKVTKSDGIELFYSYDPLGRLKTHTSSDHSIDYLYHYNLRHQIVEVDDCVQNSHSYFVYDELGRLMGETLSNGLTIQYDYDQLDRVKGLTFPDQSRVAYSYDALNLRQVDRYQKNTLLYTHRYEAFDQAGLNLKSIAINQHPLLFQYDRHKRPFSIDTAQFKQTQAIYDRGGRLRHYHLQDAIGAAHIRFDFDDNDHLVKEEGDIQHTYICDSLHNRIAKNQILHTTNGLHQLICNGESTFTYDQVGNLKSQLKGNRTTRYKYDALDRLIAVKTDNETTHYVYDAFNRRIRKDKENQTTRYLYIGQDEVGAVDKSENIQELRILGQGHGAEIGASIAIELQRNVFVPSHDFRGNVVALTDLSGQLIEGYRYTAFGETVIYNSAKEKIAASLVGNPWQFSSKRLDEESGFVYFGRRYYDPVNGRWITSDPAGLSDGPNLYAYLHHRPVQAFDLYGLQEEPYYPLQNVDYHDREAPQQAEESKQNQESPIGFVEKKKGKKDRMFFCGINQVAEVGISWMNGIMNSLKDSSVTAKALSEMADDHYVTFVYNQSHGFIADVVRCFFELYFYAQTPAVKNLQARWDAYFAYAGENSHIFHACHSEGAIITRNALMTYPEELRNRIIVVAIAPGAYISKQYAHQVTHYRSTRDVVPFFDFVGAYRCRDSTVVLKPHPEASWFDHSVNSPTYQKSVKYQIDTYIEQYGNSTCEKAA